MSTTLNPADKAATVTITNGDLTMSSVGGAIGNVRSVASHSTGKYFCEMTVDLSAVAYNNGVGVANSSASLTAGPGSPDTNSVCYYEGDSNVYAAGSGVGNTGVTYGLGDVVGMAVDMDNSTIWFRVNGGNWNGSGVADPTTNTGGYDISAVSKAWLAIGTNGNVGVSSNTFNFGATAYGTAAPSGFGQWGGGVADTLFAQSVM